MNDADYQKLYCEVDKELVTPAWRAKLAAIAAHANDPEIERLTAECQRQHALVEELLTIATPFVEDWFPTSRQSAQYKDDLLARLARIRAAKGTP